jgi:anti-anti-sigma factor
MHRSESDASLVLAVEGEIELDTVGLFHHAYKDAFQMVAADAQPEKGIVVDLSRCCYVDSAGLLALVDAQKEAQEAGIRLVFASLSPFVDRALQLTRLFHRLTVAATGGKHSKDFDPGMLP